MQDASASCSSFAIEKYAECFGEVKYLCTVDIAQICSISFRTCNTFTTTYLMKRNEYHCHRWMR